MSFVDLSPPVPRRHVPTRRARTWTAAFATLLAGVGLAVVTGIQPAAADPAPNITHTVQTFNRDNCTVTEEYVYTAPNATIVFFEKIATEAKLGVVVRRTTVDLNDTTIGVRKVFDLSNTPGLCGKTEGGAWYYSKTAIAAAASNAVFVGTIASGQIILGLRGKDPTDARVNALCGAIAGASSNAVSNAILGNRAWGQLLGGALTSTFTDAIGVPAGAKLLKWAQKLAIARGFVAPGAPGVEIPAVGQVTAVAAAVAADATDYWLNHHLGNP